MNRVAVVVVVVLCCAMTATAQDTKTFALPRHQVVVSGGAGDINHHAVGFMGVDVAEYVSKNFGVTTGFATSFQTIQQYSVSGGAVLRAPINRNLIFLLNMGPAYNFNKYANLWSMGFSGQVESPISEHVSVLFGAGCAFAMQSRGVHSSTSVNIGAGISYRWGTVGRTLASSSQPADVQPRQVNSLTNTVSLNRLGISGTMNQAGLLVQRVNADSPAERAGIRVDDVVLTIDGRPVSQFVTGEAPVIGATVKFAYRVRGMWDTEQTVESAPQPGNAKQ